MKIEKITSIPQGIYTGYVWKSNSPLPDIYDNGEYQGLESSSVSNPFVVEGMLYAEDSKSSYCIRFDDGSYRMTQFILDGEDEGGYILDSVVEFVANTRFESVGKLLFRQLWKSVPDPLCDGMESYKPVAQVFVGFKKK